MTCWADHACRFDPYFYRDEEDENEQLDEDEWDEFCEDVIQTNVGGRQPEDMSHIYSRRDC